VCVHKYMSVCAQVHSRVCVCVSLSLSMCVSVCVCVCVCVYVCMYVFKGQLVKLSSLLPPCGCQELILDRQAL
jgi:hypothetical protein